MATARSRRTPVPPVEPAGDVAPLVEDSAPTPAEVIAAVGVTGQEAADALVVAADALAAAVAQAGAAEPEPGLPTRFVVARHEGLKTYAVLARTSLEGWDGWSYVEDLPEGEPPLLPARYAPAAD